MSGDELTTNRNVFATQRNMEAADALLRSFDELTPAMREQVLREIKKTNDDRLAKEAVQKARTLDQIAEEFKGKKLEFEGLSTGHKELDEYLLGLKDGDVVVVGAYTGLGKSTFIMDLAFQMQMQGVNSCLFALEDGDFEVGTRATFLKGGNPQYNDKHKGQAYLYSKEGVPLLYKNKFSFFPAVEALLMVKQTKVIFLDMLNDILDPIMDSDADDFMVELKSVADRLGVIFVITARLREPKGMSEAARKKELLAPNEDAIYGKSMIKFLATKIITIAASGNHEYQPSTGFGSPEVKYLTFNVMKNRVGRVTKPTGGGITMKLERGPSYMRLVEHGFEEFPDV